MFRLFRLLCCLLSLGGFLFLIAGFQVAAQEKKDTAKNQPNVYNKLNVKEGFRVEKLYDVPEKTQGSWVSMTVDPMGRLIVSDQYGKLWRVTLPEIDNKDGKVKVEPINVNIGEAQGLLWAFDSLYVSVNRGQKYQSGLYRVTDENKDGDLDTVKQLRALQGGGEHGPHAVLLSPDGKSITLFCGNHTNLTKFDKSRVPEVWGEDSLLPRMWDARGHARGRMAPGGWIAKVSPNGENWELWCAGFRNQYDGAFNKNGDLFTYDSDMEWDMNTPWYRPTRVYHCVSGVDFAWRGATAKFPPYYPDTLTPVIDIGPGSPTGVTFGYGAKFPAKYQNALYICDWSYGKLYAVHLTPEGSTYKGEAEEFITGTPLALTDIVVNPKDGAMYFATGGRRSESHLYRVTYVGKESTKPAPVKDSAENVAARKLRKKLAAFHGQKNPKAIEVAWPYLGNDDRFIRAAARVAIEHQDPKLWQDKALSETDPVAAMEALVALSRTGDKALQPKIFSSLGNIELQKLSREQKLALMRAYGLACIRMGEPSEQWKEKIISRFDPLYPAGSDKDMNWELAKLLIYLEAPSAASKTIALMKDAVTQEEQMAYALELRNLKNGWNKDLREDYFRWFLKATGYKGGASFGGFVNNIKKDAVATLSPQEKKALQPILTAKGKNNSPAVAPPRPFVREWKLDELVAKLDGLNGQRDFDRGRKMFAAANCYSCHRYGNEGGATGPDLTGVAGRFSPKDLLESIIDPSKTISDQYGAVVVVTDDGKVITGRIVNLAGDSLRINTDMYNPDLQASVNRNRIESMFPAKQSMMPTGLLNSLNEDEILDLMAYLLSRGDRNNPMFRKE